MLTLHQHGFHGPKLIYQIRKLMKRYNNYFSFIKNSNILYFINPNVKSQKRIGPHNKDIISILVGSLLGDCHAERLMNGGVRFSFKQSKKHKDYLYFLYEKIKNLGYTNLNLPHLYKVKLNNKMYEYYSFHTYSFSSLI
jgi:LAGLIDADG DNA endonuclease family